MRSRLPAPRERADEFVERIVAADILPHGDEAPPRHPKASGVNGTGFAIESLSGRQRSYGLDDRLGIEAARIGDDGRRPRRFLEAFDAAESAARRTCHTAAAGSIGFRTVLGQPGPEFDAEWCRENVETGNFAGALD